MKGIKKERRRFERYDTELKVFYKVVYEVKTRVQFQLFYTARPKVIPRKYSGISQNISVNGLCFTTKKKLVRGDLLFLDVYPPNVKKPSHMIGEVRWCRRLSAGPGKQKAFRVGIEIRLVEDRSVADSIHFDKKYKVLWSIVLESLFSNFKSMVKSFKKELLK